MTFEQIAWMIICLSMWAAIFCCFLLLAIAAIWSVYTLAKTIWSLFYARKIPS